VLNRKPPAGSFEGWSFAKDRSSSSIPPPGVTPRRPEPPPPPPPPPASSAAPNQQRTTAGPARTTSGTGVGPTGQQPGAGSPSSAGQLPTSSDPATSSPGSTETNESVVAGQRASGSDRPPELAVLVGPSWSTLIGGSLVVLLLAVAGFIAYRRRVRESRTSADPPPEPDAGP
jgi:hypothetical protein